jgi:putative FmdB family regulatory protein
MPIYEYECGRCHKIIEKSYDRVPDTVPQFISCEECSTKKITVFAKRIMSAFGFHVKGGTPRFYK